jgi:hypothetical protein
LLLLLELLLLHLLHTLGQWLPEADSLSAL